MGIFDSCLLVSDIDGTLMENGKIPKVNIEAIEFFKSQGGIFAIATGRGPSISANICKKCGVNSPVLLSNGSVIYDVYKNEILYAEYLTDNTLTLMQKAIDNFSDIGLVITLGDCIVTANDTEYTQKHRIEEGIPYIYKSIEELRKLPVIKDLFMTDDTERIEELKRYLEEIKIPDCTYIVTSPYYYEIHVKGINKSVNLTRLADMMNVNYNNIFAIGDYYNDLEMVEKASIGAFCENSPEDLKLKADYIAKNVKDGAVADFIYYLSKVRKEEEDG